jgi:hypothetical protein
MAVEDESLRRAVAGLLCSMLSVRYERDRVKFYKGSSKTPRSEFVNESMESATRADAGLAIPRVGRDIPRTLNSHFLEIWLSLTSLIHLYPSF